MLLANKGISKTNAILYLYPYFLVQADGLFGACSVYSSCKIDCSDDKTHDMIKKEKKINK